LGGKPGGDDPSTMSTNALSLVFDIWDLETFRCRLDDIRNIKQIIFPPINNKTDFYIGDDGLGGYKDDIYASSGGGLDSDGNDFYNNNKGSDNDTNNVQNALNGLDAPLLSGGDLAEIDSTIKPFFIIQTTTRL
jgi:hypothetical protein